MDLPAQVVHGLIRMMKERDIRNIVKTEQKPLPKRLQLKRLGADFFAKHSVAELAALTDHEIGKKGRIAQPDVSAERRNKLPGYFLGKCISENCCCVK